MRPAMKNAVGALDTNNKKQKIKVPTVLLVPVRIQLNALSSGDFLRPAFEARLRNACANVSHTACYEKETLSSGLAV